MIELLSLIIVAFHYFLSGLSIASSYDWRLPLIIVEASALCISSEMCTCALLLVTVPVSTGAHGLVLTATDRRECLYTISLPLEGTLW
jgi:hypothetical protein